LIGVVVPTLGKRPGMLEACLSSIRDGGENYITLVCPADFEASSILAIGLADQVVIESGVGLASAINQGIRATPQPIDAVTWLGDDDSLEPGALDVLSQTLTTNPKVVAAFGACHFITEEGQRFSRSRLGAAAVFLLHFGPDYIPQPASAFRRSAFETVGGLSENLNFAFDLDLFLRLSKVGKLKYIPRLLASYRWHPGSLSAANQIASRDEARRVRADHLPRFLRVVSFLWESPMEFLASKNLRLDKLSLRSRGIFSRSDKS
jgi:GT2 family glycosyltransferase